MLSIKTQDIASQALVERQPDVPITASTTPPHPPPSSSPPPPLPPPPSSTPPPTGEHDHDNEHEPKQQQQDEHQLQVVEKCEELAPNQRPFGPEDSCDCNPEFAVICSFINVFGAKIDLQLNIEQLKDSIENQEILDDSLVDIHVKLFKKLRRYFVRDQWEKALIRFAHEYSYEHAQEIEQLGYLKTRPSVKLELLRRLLDVQFECDPKFKAAVNLDEANDLRTQPVGRDIKGNSYWYCIDNESNFRVFSEEPLNHKSWRLVCKSSEGFHELLAELERIKDDKVKGERQTEPYNPYPEIFSEYFTNSDNLKENQETIKQPIVAKYKLKKGSKNSLLKKSDLSPPPLPVKQIDDDDDVTLIKQELPPIKQEPHHIKQEPHHIKQELSLIKQERSIIKQELQSTNSHEHIPLTNPTSPSSAARASPNGNGSIDSQVKQTLDNILTKVVTSFEFFFRRSSDANHHNGVIKLDHEEAKKEDGANVKPVKKRGGRREKAKVEELPRRSSSRIQQLQQKKITNYFESSKKEPEPAREATTTTAATTTTTTSRPRAIKEESRSSTTSNGHSKSGKRVKKDKQRWRAKGKKKLSWDKDDSDLSSISSPTESDNDESFLEEIDGALNPESSNNEDYDEFACEEEDNSDEPIIVKRARTARQSMATELNGTLNSTSISMLEEDKPCGRCDKSDDAEWILLCDMCDDGYHTTCCVPPLMFVPDGDWFCPPCEHKMLTGKLKEILTNLDAMLEAKERERQKRQRLRAKTVRREPVHSEPVGGNVERISEKRNRHNLPDLNEPLAVQALDEMLDGVEDCGGGGGSRTHHLELPNTHRERAGQRKRKKKSSGRKRNKIKRRRRRRHYDSGDDYDDNDDDDDDDDHDDDDSEDELLMDRKSRKEDTRRKIAEAEALDYGLDMSATDNEGAESAKSSSVDWASGAGESSTDNYESEKVSSSSASASSASAEESSEEEEEEEEQLQTRKARARVNYSFQEYDELIKSAIGDETDHHETDDKDNDDDDDDDDPEVDEEGEVRTYGRGKDMATIEALAYQQENGLIEQGAAAAAAEVSVDVAVAPLEMTPTDASGAAESSVNPEGELVISQASAAEPTPTTTADRKSKVIKSRKKGRKLNDLDAESEIDIATSDESFQASSGSEIDEDDEDEVTEIDEETDSSIDELVANFKVRTGRNKRKKSKTKKSKSKKKKKGKVKYFSDSDDSDDDYY